jgi:uncharacterized protein (DUF433 family)
MIPKQLEHVLSHSPDIMSGAICFVGTRVPVQALLDTLDDGDNVSDFLQGFPDVTAQQAQAVLRWEQSQARQALELEPAE